MADVLIGLELLDRQVIDRDGKPVGKVDDVELSYDADGTVRVTALLLGQAVLGDRIGGRLGRCVAGAARRLSGAADRPPQRISADLIGEVTSAVNLTVKAELLAEPPLEGWLRDHLIGRIPGAGNAS